MGTLKTMPRCCTIVLFVIIQLMINIPDSYAQGLKGDKQQEGSTSTRRVSSASGSSSGYKTAIGLRGGFTSGVTFKHFIARNGALEFILGPRWHGVSLTGLYEFHSANAFDASGLSWVFGGGVRLGYYQGKYYYGYLPCKDPDNPKCYGYWEGRYVSPFGIVGIAGLEYQFEEVPLTISLDLMPYFYIYHWRSTFLDASISIRYIIQ